LREVGVTLDRLFRIVAKPIMPMNREYQIIDTLGDNTLKFWIERRIIVSINTSSIFEQSTIGVEQILPKQFRKS
jgi:hypothetical protein